MSVEEKTESNLLKFIRYFVVLLVAVGLAFAVYYRLSHQKLKQIKEAVAVQDTINQNDKQSKILPKDFSPSADDIVNLAMAMHGAAGQQPNDAPKDKYGRAYIIGDLGGVPVNLPRSVVRFVEYDDSPGWNPEALRNYKPSVRSYQSIIESFGFTFRHHDAVLLDRANHKLNQQYEKRGNTFSPEEDWVRVHINSGKRYPPPGGLDRIVSGYLDEPHKYVEWNYWVKLPKKQFDLETYIQPEKSPKTGETFRKKDMFLYRYPNGKVKTMILCSNIKGPTPPCGHKFVFPPPMKIKIEVSYTRQMLSHWREIEKNTITFINSFQADSKANQSNETNQTGAE